MYIIGERINGMFEDIKKAIISRDEGILRDWVARQKDAGADALDVNVGPASAEPVQAMEWLVKTIRKFADLPLSIDTTKFDVMEKGLALAGEGSILNSVNGDNEKLDRFLPLVKKYKTKFIALTMDKKGIPKDCEGRVEIAANIVAKAVEYEIDINDIFIDAVILPVGVAQEHLPEVLETIKQVKMISDPSPRTVLGLSNVSQKTLDRPLINRTYLIMAVAFGLDSAILDPTDKPLVDAGITAELLMNKAIYCDNYLEAYRKK